MQFKTSIRQTLSTVIVFSSLMAGVVSCKKDKDHNPGTPPPPAASILSEYKNDDNFIRFDYNVDGTVKKATLKSDLNTNGGIIEYNITYNASKKISELQTSAGEKIIPVYENNILKRADVFENNERTGYYNYHFENNLLSKVTLYFGADTEYEPYFELNFTYDNAGNNTETAAFVATGQPGLLVRAGHIIYTYDTKTNPLSGNKELLTLLWQAASKNNIVQEDHFDSNQVLEDRYTYTYTYKTNGLPDHGEVKIGLPGETPTISQVDYIYK